MSIDPLTGNPTEPQRAPSSWFGGPVVRPDGLAADTPGRSLRARIPILFNPIVRALLFAAVAAAVVMVGFVLVALVIPPAQLTPGHPVAVAVAIVGVLVAYLILARLIERRKSPVELAPNRALGLLWGVLFGAGAFLVAYLLITLLGGFRLTGTAEVNWSHWWWQVLISGVSAGVIEEILFRGILYRLLEEFIGTWIAVAISGLVFGLVHITNPDATWWGAIAIALEFGLLMGVVYAFTRSLWIVIGIHFAWNVVQGPVMGVVVSGTGGAPSLLITDSRSPDLISGGSFGAEASLLTVLMMLGVAVVVAVLLVRRRAVVAPMWVRRARQRAAIQGTVEPASGRMSAQDSPSNSRTFGTS